MLNRSGNRLDIQRREPDRIDDLGRDADLIEQMLRAQRLDHHVADRDDSDVLAFGQNARLAGHYRERLFGYDTGILIEHAMLHHHDRVVVTDRGDHAALGVMRRSRRHDFEAWHMHEIGMEGLAVLGALPPAAADDGTLDNRH